MPSRNKHQLAHLIEILPRAIITLGIKAVSISIASAFIETIFIFYIPLVLSSFIDKGNYEISVPAINGLIKLLSLSTIESILILIALCILSGVCRYWSLSCNSDFVKRLTVFISEYCLNSFLFRFQNFEDKLTTGNILNTLTVNIQRLSQVLFVVVQALTSAFLLTVLCVSLYYGIGISFLLVLASASLLFGLQGRVVSKYLRLNSKIVQESYSGLQQFVKDVFSSIDTIIIYDEVSTVNEKFNKIQSKLRTSVRSSDILTGLGRLVVEPSLYLGLILYAYIIYTTSGSLSFISKLSLLAVSVPRLLGSLQSILQAFTTYFRYSDEIRDVSTLLVGMHLKTQYSIKPISKDHTTPLCIELDNIKYSYNSATQPVSCSYSFNRFGITSIVGSSGSGKTTLLKILLGLLKPSAGILKINNIDVFSDLQNIRTWQSQIAYVPQFLYAIHSNLYEQITTKRFQKGFIDKRYIRILNDCMLTSLENNYPSSTTILKEGGKNLSGGQLQRVFIAKALYSSKAAIIMDEPTSALDRQTALSIIATLKKYSRMQTIISVTHSLDLIKASDNILKLPQS